MKILFVTPFLPSPPRFGGQRRLDGLMRELARNHEVNVLAFNRTDEWEHSSLTETRRYCGEVVCFPNLDLTDTREKRTLQLRSLASSHSFEHLLAVRRREFQRALRDMLQATQYDVVQFEFMQMAAFRFERSARVRPTFVLDEHNIEYDILKRTAGASGAIPRLVYNSLNWRKLAREEHTAWQRFDGVALTSARDEALLRSESPRVPTAVIPNGVDLTAFSPATAPTDPDMLLFFGAINYQPNHDGVVYFIDHVLPKIRRANPRVKFCILGPGARQEVHDRKGNGVEVLGMVDDVGPYIEKAAAIVVPLRVGGGTRLKIVEALAKGKAIVSTRLGAEGLDVVHERHLLLADEPDDFADQVSRVLADAELARRLGNNGRELVERQYGWQSIVQRLLDFYGQLRASRP
ncbi:MAG: glycosyltransferase [Myxococcales bacterium]|jgi:glycosyltransferase involved in cell wall biosynthesis